MINFFRKIRKKLAGDNQFFKYTRYAIGEILLVVIGILIALQINNWNETKKNLEIERNFYADVLTDLEKDRIELTNLKIFYDNRIEQLGWLLKELRNTRSQTDVLEFGQHVEPLYYNMPPVSYASAFEAAKSSGSFEKFRNKNILKDLTQYYSDFQKIDALLTSTLRIIETQLEPIMAAIPENYIQTQSSSNVLAINQHDNNEFYEYLSQIEDNRDIDIDLKTFLQEPKLENYLIGDMGRSFNCLATLKTRSEVLSQISKEIKTYLND